MLLLADDERSSMHPLATCYYAMHTRRSTGPAKETLPLDDTAAGWWR
jgi:hypothetical protein